MTITARRRQEVGEFFATNADRLQRAVRRRVGRASSEIIDDACQFAWATLLRRPDIALDHHGYGWLVTVAVHEGWRLLVTATATATGSFFCPPSPGDDADKDEPVDEDRGTEQKALDRLEHRERLDAVRALKPPQREALYLKALGYSYHEIMALTDSTYTAVNRRITEGRAALRRHLGDDRGPRQWERGRRAAEPIATEGGELDIDPP